MRSTTPRCRALPPGFLALLLLAAPAAAQTGGLEAGQRLAVDSVFAAFDRADSPGCAVGVYRGGALAYARGYGLADLEHRVPIAAHTVFDIGSTSKQFSAAAIALLAADGVLSIDDDVRRWVPELPDYGERITIRHLLNHTSGLRDYIALLTLGGARTDDVTTADQALAAIVRQGELNFSPGAEYLYSNSGFFLLSVIVERASGQSLRNLARARIFDPLGMRATHYLGSYDDVVPGRASAYAPRPGGGWRLDVSRWLQTGDGAVFTTVEELLHWDENFHSPRVGGQALLDALHVRGVLTNGDTLPYALGLILGSHRGARTVSHGGSWGGYRAELLRFPDARTSLAVLCNAANANAPALARQAADAVLGSTLAPPAPPVTTPSGAATPASVPDFVTLTGAQLATIAGTFHSAELDARFQLVAQDGGVVLLRPPGLRQPLLAVGADELTAGGARLRLQRDASGVVSAFLLDVGRVRNLRFTRVE
jgi:CubicO group peptidase (beta-lactamase class C family)